MPTYEYECQECGATYRVFHGMSADGPADCTEARGAATEVAAGDAGLPDSCGGKVEKLLSGGTGLIFKGSGFYITDYKNADKKPESKVGSADKKPADGETKSSDKGAEGTKAESGSPGSNGTASAAAKEAPKAASSTTKPASKAE